MATFQTAQTAQTQYVTASTGVRFAYRRFGLSSGIPLVLHIHFRANQDHWDPLFLNTIAKARPVITFDNQGVGKTSGEVPNTYQGWADDLISFVSVLGLEKIDLLGFSMGGVAVQFVVVTAPNLVRRLICAGTGAPVPDVENLPHVVWPRDVPETKPLELLAASDNLADDKAALAYSFFYDTSHGRSAFDAYWKRLSERTVEPVYLRLLDHNVGGKRQMEAAGKELRATSESGLFARLSEIKAPVLVANGDQDLLIPSSRSWELYSQLPHAQLIMYPKAGHGFLWQYPKLFGEHVNRFLDSDEYDSLLSKL